MQAKARIKNFRTTPRKARLIADFIRGKDLKRVLAELKFINKKAAIGFSKLLSSAKANAENNFSMKADDLFVKSVTVNEGQVLKRYRPGSQGRALPIKRRLSRIEVVLSERKKKGKKKNVKKEK